MMKSDAQTGPRNLPRDPSAPSHQQISTSTNPKFLHAFLILFVLATFVLLGLGGTVTSKGVGMAVPDWPTTYGENMFTFPVSKWVGGIKWEHSHRLMGSLVGMLSIIACAWIWLTQKHRPWLRSMGVAALLLVIVQGVLGGLRVLKDPSHPNLAITMAIVHGITAQLFLCMTVVLAAATGSIWRRFAHAGGRMTTAQKACLVMLGAIVLQLVLGASTRHTGSGTAIPDFPASYGSAIPPFTHEGIVHGAETVGLADSLNYPTPAQVGIHFAHRVGAVLVLAAAMWAFTQIAKVAQGRTELLMPMFSLILLLLAQVALGALVVWTGRHEHVATTHQMIGAVLLATATLLTVRVYLMDGGAGLEVRDGRQEGAGAGDGPARLDGTVRETMGAGA